MTADAPNAPAELTPRESERRRGGGLFRLLVLGVTLGTGVWFLPELVARTQLRQQVPPLLFPWFQGRIALGETSLGWTAPLVVRDIAVSDAAGEPLLKIAELRSTRSLWQIASDRMVLGRFDLVGLTADVVARPDGTNFDGTIRDFWEAPVTGPQPGIELVIDDARIAVTTPEQADPIVLPPIDTHLSVALEDRDRVDVEVTAHGTTDPASRLSLRTSTTISQASGPLEVAVTAAEWQLAQFMPLLRPYSGGGELWGLVTGDATLSVTTMSPMSWTIESRLTARELAVVDWPALQGDDLRLETAAVAGRIGAVDRVIECRDVRIESPLAEVVANGTWSLPSWAMSTAAPAENETAAKPTESATSPSESLLAILDEDFTLKGWIDGAAVARQLPQVLQLRKGTELETAKLTWELVSREEDGVRVWAGRGGLDSIAARTGGTAWTWESPLTVALRLTRPDAEWRCDEFTVESDVLQASGAGSLRNAQVKATADLAMLARKLAALTTWEASQLAGRLSLQGRIVVTPEERYQLQALTNVEDLVLGPPTDPWWREVALQAKLNVLGAGPATSPWDVLDAGRIVVAAGTDQLDVELLESVRWADPQAVLPLNAKLTGDLSRWQIRLAPWWPTSLGAIAGNAVVTTALRHSTNQTDVQPTTIQVDGLRWELPGWRIDEPRLEVATQGTWLAKNGSWRTPETELRGSFGSIRWTEGEYLSTTSTALPVTGQLDYDVDLGRFSRWQTGGVTRHVLGKARGTCELQPRETDWGLNLAGTIENLTLVGLRSAASAASQPAGTSPWVALWKEPRLEYRATAVHQPSTGRWAVRDGQLLADGLGFAGDALLQPSPEALRFDLRGNLRYDWETVSTRLDPSITETLQLTGAGTRPITLRGTMPMSAATPVEGATVTPYELTGDVGLGWDAAIVMGMPLGPAELQGHFTGQDGRLEPVSLEVAEGRVQLAPRFQFQPGPPLMQLPDGRLVDQVRLSPELCRNGLKFVTPLLADATEVDGRFSLDLVGAAWPLTDFAAGRTDGTLAIHGAQVRPGPLAARLAGFVEQVRALVERRQPRADVVQRVLLELPEQNVRFRQADRGVIHDRFLMRMGDVDLETRGRVGFDESLNLVVSIPLREEWIADEKVRAALGGQLLQVPVGGTLRQPQLDPRALNDLARRAAVNGVERLIQGKLQDQLDKLLPRQ
jgi:hypothetical protein